MYQKLILCLLSLLWVKVVWAQADSLEKVEPILIDKAALSGRGLKQLTLKDQPDRAFFQRSVYRGPTLSVYIVSSESWLGQMNNFAIDEYVYMLNGRARVQAKGGKSQYVHSGEHFFAPKGFTGEWEIQAGENYHYELSVITTKRADSVSLSRSIDPQILAKDRLSGVEIALDENGFFKQTLVRGDELTLTLHAERPRDQEYFNEAEQIICLLSGQITFTTETETTHVYHSGDYIILPKGCVGNWKSEGHGMIKYFTIEKTE